MVSKAVQLFINKLQYSFLMKTRGSLALISFFFLYLLWLFFESLALRECHLFHNLKYQKSNDHSMAEEID